MKGSVWLSLVLLLLTGCALDPGSPRETSAWEPVWLMLPDGSEVRVMGQRVPWAPPGYVVIQGDILVPQSPIPPSTLAPQGLAQDPIAWGRLWPGGVVPYTIDPGVSPDQRARIQEAIAHIHEKTSIRLVERTDQADYVRFISDGRPEICWSYLGRIGGPQDLDVYCGQNGVPSVGTVVHEILHALGFLHEQSRADRDEYVEILWENIQEESWPQFAKIGGRGKLYQTYDYESVMHYGAKAFSKNGNYTILPKNGIPPERIGQSQGLSPGDIESIRLYYTAPMVRLRWWFHQTTFTTNYSFPQEVLNVGAVDAWLEGVVLEGTWLQGATPQTAEIPAGGSATLLFQAKPCPSLGFQAETVGLRVQSGETYQITYTRACYRYPDVLTLLRLEPAGRETLLLTFAEWTWAKRYALEGTVNGASIALPYRDLSSDRAQPLYTALLRLEGRAGQEVCLRITPLDSTAANPTPATACARVPE